MSAPGRRPDHIPPTRCLATANSTHRQCWNPANWPVEGGDSNRYTRCYQHRNSRQHSNAIQYLPGQTPTKVRVQSPGPIRIHVTPEHDEHALATTRSDVGINDDMFADQMRRITLRDNEFNKQAAMLRGRVNALEDRADRVDDWKEAVDDDIRNIVDEFKRNSTRSNKQDARLNRHDDLLQNHNNRVVGLELDMSDSYRAYDDLAQRVRHLEGDRPQMPGNMDHGDSGQVQ